MRIRTVLATVVLFSAIGINSSCKKAIQKKYEDAIMQMMTSGSWKITFFKEGGTDITTSFNGYLSTFYDNGTMVATNGTTSYSGSWNGNFNAQTFTAAFTNAADPVQKLNGTWNILPTSNTTVGKFTQTKNGISYEMELTKY